MTLLNLKRYPDRVLYCEKLAVTVLVFHLHAFFAVFMYCIQQVRWPEIISL